MTDLEVRAGVSSILQKAGREAPNGPTREQAEETFRALIELFARADAERAQQREESSLL